MGVAVLVGTRKGLFVLTSDETRRDWNVEGPHLTGFEVFHATRDPRDGTVHAATNNWVYGATAHRSSDQGETWDPDERYPEVGQCVRKLLAHPAKPERLWQQNHCGVYRSDDRGDDWERLEDNGLPSGFGFPLALDPADPDVAFVIPEEGAENRVTPNGRLGGYRTRDGGGSRGVVGGGAAPPAGAAGQGGGGS